MIRLFEIAHEEARRLVATGAPVTLEVNPAEYHGPHLPLLNDALVSAGLAGDLHRRLAERHPDWPFLLAAPIQAGVQVCPGPGARETPYADAKRLVLEACRTLADLGARRVVLMTFHGGPLHNLALHAGVRLLESRGVQAFAPLSVVLHEMLALDPARYEGALAHVEDREERAAILRELQFDFHAGFFETSLSLHYAPGAVAPSYRSLAPCPPLPKARFLALAARVAEKLGRRATAAELRFAAAGKGWYALDPFPGYTGRPAHASATAGAFFAREIVDRYVAQAEEIFAGRARSPRPIMSWLAAATLGGRLGHGPPPRLRVS